LYLLDTRLIHYGQVIDYQEHAPVHQYLATHYSNAHFSAVIDAYGVQDLYTHCADYLDPGKPFVTVGVAFDEYTVSSIMYAVFLMMNNSLWPRVLGGVPREYASVSGFTNLEVMEKLGQLVEEGKMKVVVDSCWDMEDVLKVRLNRSRIPITGALRNKTDSKT
jgi:hypothetical protein